MALVIGVPCAAIGFLVARRQPRNPLGWLFLVIAIFLFVPTVGGDYAYLNYVLGAPAAVRRRWAGRRWALVRGPGAVHRGDPAVPRRQAAVPVLALGAAGLVRGVRGAARRLPWSPPARALAAHPVRIDTSGGLVALDNPAGWFAVVYHGCLLVLFVLSVAFIGRQVLSWRRSSGERRQQLKWLASGAAVSIVSLVLAVIFASSSGSDRDRRAVAR